MTGKIVMVVAMDNNRCIGRKGQVPWRLKRDMKHFRAVTSAKTVVMGRKTWDSIPERFRPLPNRRNVILTRNPYYHAEGAEVMHSLEEVMDKVSEDLYVIGGGEIYDAFMPVADKLVITCVHAEIEGGDAFFPSMPSEQWTSKELHFVHLADENNEHDFEVVSYERISPVG